MRASVRHVKFASGVTSTAALPDSRGRPYQVRAASARAVFLPAVGYPTAMRKRAIHYSTRESRQHTDERLQNLPNSQAGPHDDPASSGRDTFRPPYRVGGADFAPL